MKISAEIVWTLFILNSVFCLKLCSKEGMLTPLKLHFLLRCGHENAGETLFGSMNYFRSRVAINHLQAIQTIDFSGHFNRGCKHLNRTSFAEVKDAMEDITVIRLSCVSNLKISKGDYLPILEELPHLIIDNIPVNMRGVGPAFKHLFRQTLQSKNTRSSVPICKSLLSRDYLDIAKDTTAGWRISDAYCMLSAPKLAEELLPVVFEMNCDPTVYLSELEKLLHVVSTTLMFMRLAPNSNGLRRFLRIVKDCKLRKENTSRYPCNENIEFMLVHQILGSYLYSLIDEVLLHKNPRNTDSEYETLVDPLNRLWNLLKKQASNKILSDYGNIRFLTISILLELSPVPNISRHERFLFDIISADRLQDRHLCLIFDILSRFPEDRADGLRSILTEHLEERGDAKVFKCRRPPGYANIYPLLKDQKIMTRRKLLHLSVEIAQEDEFLLRAIRRAPWKDVLVNLQKYVFQKIIHLVERNCIITRIPVNETPLIMFALETHPYKIHRLWGMLIISSSLRIKLPFSIHPCVMRAFVTGDDKDFVRIYRLLKEVQVEKQKSYISRNLTHQAIIGLLGTSKKNENGLSPSKSAYYYHVLSEAIAEPLIRQSFPPISVTLKRFFKLWRQNAVVMEIDDADYLIKNPELFAECLTFPLYK